MFGNWRIGRPFGIDVFVSGWFWLLPLVVFLSSVSAGGFTAALINTLSLIALFACVALHELGHALAARGYGIRTRDITLYPIGGVARLERMPERPLAEIAIALAGPAVNVVIAAVLGAFLMAMNAMVVPTAAAVTVYGFLERLFLGNVILVAFNLIPAFPMDGGRVFRAFMNWFTDRTTATRVAGVVGSVFAVLFGLFGLFTGNLLLVFLAVAVFLMGRQEVAAVKQQEAWKRRQAAWEDVEADWPDRWYRSGRRDRAEGDGWVFDARTGEWTEYRNGWPMRGFRQ